MQSFTVFSAVEQVAGHLRRELQRGEWGETMPGVNPLVAELGVNHKTVEAALRLLEDEGLLVNQGRGFQRRIVVREDDAPRPMRVALLEFDAPSRNALDSNEMRYRLEAAGHIAFFTDNTIICVGS